MAKRKVYTEPQGPLAEVFEHQWKAWGLPEITPENREFHFWSGRAWRSDYGWPVLGVIVELEGGTRQNGRHNRHAGMTEDANKYNMAQLLGYKVYRFTSEQITSGQAVAFMLRAMNQALASNGQDPIVGPDVPAYDGTLTMAQYYREVAERQDQSAQDQTEG